MQFSRLLLVLALQGVVFAVLNIITTMFLGAFGIDPVQVFQQLVTGGIPMDFTIVYIPVVLLLWGVYVTIIARFIRV